MNSRLRLLAVIVLMAATALTLAHWHQDFDGQRCELCRVQQQAGLHTPVQNPIAAPFVQEWLHVTVGIVSESEAFVPRSYGRSPPAAFLA